MVNGHRFSSMSLGKILNRVISLCLRNTCLIVESVLFQPILANFTPRTA